MRIAVGRCQRIKWLLIDDSIVNDDNPADDGVGKNVYTKWGSVVWDGSESEITKQVFVSLRYFSKQMEERTFKIKKDNIRGKWRRRAKKVGIVKELKVVGEELNGIQDRKYTKKNYWKEKLVNIRWIFI